MESRMSKSTFRILLICLVILTLFSVFIFGLRILILLFINLFIATIIEYMYLDDKKYKFKREIIITSFIFTLTLPPGFSFILSGLGISFGVFFGKCLYGGTGYNIFNPALVGRVFLHASFTKQMTTVWTKPILTPLGGFISYIGVPTDVVSSATPLLTFRWSGEETDIIKLFTGFTEGSIGETSAVLLILIAIILLFKKIISKEVVFSILISYSLITFLSSKISSVQIINPIYGLLTGGILFGAILMATDPVTSPETKEAKILYGIIIGVITFVLRTYSIFAGGVMFAILIGNMLSPILDISVRYYQNKSFFIKRGNENV